MTHPTVDDWLRPRDRRGFLLAASSFAFMPLLGREAHGFLPRSGFKAEPFSLGVASGDPSPDGFVIWTRLAPDPLNGGGMPKENVEVRWEIAHDEKMSKIVQRGTTMATPELGHSVHVEVEGLEPDRWYWYRFGSNGAASRTGRSRTTPRFDASPQKVNFAFASCQHFESGYFNSYRHILDDDIDLIVHLGDYIYEYGGVDGRVRKHTGKEINSLDEYRNRYALYRTDTDLKAAHQMFPWLVTWDDHEFDNNCAGDISEEPGVKTAGYLARRARAYQAYYEHMPLRKSSIPKGPFLQLYRSVPFGNLVEFEVLDTRQYRTDQPCGDGNKPPCEGVFAKDATLLGDRQEQWLMQTLHESPATWNVLAQQVMMARVDRDPESGIAWSMDQWAGYHVARHRMLSFLENRRISNPVVLTGDIHKNWVNDLKVDFDDEKSETVATEFVGTSITSGGNGSEKGSDTDGVLRDNPFVKFYNAERGYVRCQITPGEWRSDFRVVDDVTKPETTCKTRASFVVEAGRAGAERA
ncbi:MAG: alkaline phosphatase D family protein [Planctomycetota bacterium]|nr:alkaline phosphatase D family protein [Planctomycetota bacterium]MDA1250101.1 alkaline phosphatase D family protein [Planctomycetota bacterium]